MRYLILCLSILLLCSCQQNEEAPAPVNKTERQRSLQTQIPEPDIEEPPLQSVEYETTLSSAQTTLIDSSDSRVSNIDLACGAINGTVLYPGGSFSFNSAVGRRTEGNGYTDAPVIVDGHSEKGCGGGVCQVSSTIYMSAKNAGLQIDERHPHSHSVPYAPKGCDATVVYGEKDLRFTNNTDEIITLYVWTDGTNVFSKLTQKSS